MRCGERAEALARSERWLAGRRRLVLAVVLAAAAVVRLGYVVELWDGPLLHQHRWEESDMHFFDAWGARIAAGDWLAPEPLHPRHTWHRDLVGAYRAAHPEARREIGSMGRDPVRRVLDRWLGGPVFHQEPLYAYLLGATYALLGHDVRWVLAWQMLLGVVATGLVYGLTRRHFGPLTAAVAGALAVGCGPLVMYDLVLLRSTPATCAALALTWLLGRAREHPLPRRWLLLGLGFGAGMLLQQTLGLILLGALGMALLSRGHAVQRAARAGLLLGGLALALAPAIARNVAVGVPPLALSSVGPLVFALSNAADYDPDTGFALSAHAGRIMGESDGRLLPVVLETLRTHDGIVSWLRQLLAKLRAAWHWFEAPNNTSFYYYRLHSAVLRHLPVTFWLLAPLGALGLCLGLGRRPRPTTLYLLVGSLLVPMLVFYVLSRFRVSLTAALIPFAALALVWLVDRALARRWKVLVAALGVMALVATTSWRRLPPDVPLVRRADHVAPYLAYWGPTMEALFERREWMAAGRLLARSLGTEPPVVRRLGEDRPPVDDEEAGYAGFYGMVHYRYAQALERAGEAAGGREAMRRADVLLRLGGVTPPVPDPILPE